MTYKTYAEQIQEHIKTLNDNGLYVSDLKLNTAQWTRCHAHTTSHGRGEYSYISNTERFSNGLLGIRTSFRGPNGLGNIKTYGLPPSGNASVSHVGVHCDMPSNDGYEEVARKAYGFWQHSDLLGDSPYLAKKGVGAHGLRFRSTERFGVAAVVPMRDGSQKLWSYQLLNADGSKVMAKGGKTEGLFHMLGTPADGKPLGIAEGYATAATCYELSCIPVACAFFSENLSHVTEAIKKLYPKSAIIIFADNDRHLEAKGMANKGILKAIESFNKVGVVPSIVSPSFHQYTPSKEASDWNDYFRLFGIEETRAQLLSGIASAMWD
jgi:hypothetical protein